MPHPAQGCQGAGADHQAARRKQRGCCRCVTGLACPNCTNEYGQAAEGTEALRRLLPPGLLGSCMWAPRRLSWVVVTAAAHTRRRRAAAIACCACCYGAGAARRLAVLSHMIKLRAYLRLVGARGRTPAGPPVHAQHDSTLAYGCKGQSRQAAVSTHRSAMLSSARAPASDQRVVLQCYGKCRRKYGPMAGSAVQSDCGGHAGLAFNCPDHTPGPARPA